MAVINYLKYQWWCMIVCWCVCLWSIKSNSDDARFLFCTAPSVGRIGLGYRVCPLWIMLQWLMCREGGLFVLYKTLCLILQVDITIIRRGSMMIATVTTGGGRPREGRTMRISHGQSRPWSTIRPEISTQTDDRHPQFTEKVRQLCVKYPRL